MAKRTDEITSKTTPNLQDKVSGDQFAKDYLVWLDDASNVPQDLKDRQLIDVRQTALQRGLRPTGEPSLVSSKAIDEHNVLLTYRVPVVLAGPGAPVTGVAPEREQRARRSRAKGAKSAKPDAGK